MKRIIALLTLVMSGIIVHGQMICGIWFEYDAVGNRVVRKYDCTQIRPIDFTVGNKTSGGLLTNGSGNVHQISLNENSFSSSGNIAGNRSGKGDSISVFPNPTRGDYQIQVMWPLKQALHFHWYNASGEILSSGNFASSPYKGQMGDWADGSYWLKIYENDRIIGSWKVIKISSK